MERRRPPAGPHRHAALNPKGRDQADSVGRALRDVPDISDRVFLASPLTRAVDTMRRMRAAMGLDPDGFSTDERLAEMSFGRWEGLTFREIGEREPAAMKAREADKWSHVPPDGESYVQVCERVGALLGGLDRPAVLVSHGGVARAVLALCGADRTKLADIRIQQGRALAIEDGRWRWI
nr:histidine phosphatase family protein [Chenggangzhangella methanolivorans]